MSFAGCSISAKWVRLVCLVVFFTLVLSSLPVHFRRDSANAQSSSSKRQLPPYYKLPNLNGLITDVKKSQRPTLPRPPLKPSTICGYRDEACKRKKEKEKKVGQNFTPSNDNAVQAPDDVARKSDRNWLGRLGRAFSNALSGFTSVSAKGNSFLASDSNRSAGTPAPAAFNNTAVSAAPAMPPPSFGTLVEAKLDPRNRVGGAGEDLFSGNYNFNLSLVSLPGRAGLDLNIPLSLNSLTWIKYGNTISYDYDYYQSLTPGFRIGFPEIEGPYLVNSVNTYIVYLPSGRRVEMRQVATNKFEAIDSSYFYLDVNTLDSTKLTLYSMDGTQFKFEKPNLYSVSRCTQVKDSNGNYISIAYKIIGSLVTVIDKVTDTLGREVFFNYDSNFHLQSITQNRDGQTFYWAQFDYGTKYVAPTFGSLFVDGPNNENIPVITRVITGDGARHTFSYNSWGQVDNIWTYGEADNQRTAMVYAFPAPNINSPQSDCPRFTQRNDGIYAWPGDIYDPQTGIGWVVNYFYFEPSEAFGQVTGPDGVSHREIFSTSGNTRGLTTRTETHYGGAIQQFTDLTWASDSVASPPLRPRVTEIKICDDRNHTGGACQSGIDKLKKTTIEYTTVNGAIKLPRIVRDYNEGGGSVYRSTKTDYVTDENYLNRWIIGLPTFTYLYEGDQVTLKAQTGYVYDSAETGFLQGYASVRQHDTANYGTGFQYRGNLTKARRYSVNGGVAGSTIETKTGYYITGNAAWVKDGENHETTISYDDSFLHYTEPTPGTLNVISVPSNPPTYAYRTKVTVDETPTDLSATASYNYNFGAVTRTVDPKAYAAGGQDPPTKRVNTYDTKGRLEKSLTWKDGAKHSHTRYVYGNDHNSMSTWTTVNSLAEETFVFHMLDGVGRERIVINEHPGSQGELSGYYRVFDKVGRIGEWSRPTELDISTWAPTGDDTGYVYSKQFYDWKGRPTLFYPPGSDPNNPNDPKRRKITYDGCGCAGSDMTEFESEEAPHDGTSGRRKSRGYRDVFGREIKSEVLNWNGSVYSTQIKTYNVRDQVENIRQQVGGSGTYQDTVMSYDGYGRLSFRKRPEEGASGTTYTYYNDDMLYTSVDARGASSLFTYNARHLVNSMTYTSPDETVMPNSPSVSFQYDELGNRTVMNDGAGTLTYGYDNLGLLTNETRYFSELASHNFVYYATSQLLQTTYQIGYSYNLIGQLQHITTPTGDAIDYTRDKAGRTTKVAGTPRDGVTDYVSDVDYRAWGAEKRFSFGYQNYSIEMSHNDRMQVSQINDQDKLAATFTYTNDGMLSAVQGLNDRRLDRSFSYDHMGRVTKTRSASAAGLGSTQPAQFEQDYGYDEFSHMTLRQGKYWYTGQNTFSATFTNNIASNVMDSGQAQNWQHDAEGNVKSEVWRTHSLDSAGRQVKTVSSVSDIFYYDGDGRLVSQTYIDPNPGAPRASSTYYLWSSVLKENLAQIRIYGQHHTPGEQQLYNRDVFIYVNGQQVARREYDVDPAVNQPNLGSSVYWIHRDPLNTMARSVSWAGGSLFSIDPLGVQAAAAFQNEIDAYWTPAPDPNNPPEGFYQDAGGNPNGTPFGVPNPGQWGLGCYIDGIQTSCERAFRTISNGGAWGVTLSLHGAVGPAASPVVASFTANATSINGQSTTRMRLVPRVIPGDPNGLTIRDEFGGVVSESAPVHDINGYDAVYEIGAISGDLVFGGTPQLNWEYPVLKARREIANIAALSEGSERWLVGITNGNYAAGSNKCNGFIGDVVETATGRRPKIPYGNDTAKGRLANKIGMTRDPSAYEWADPSVRIPGFMVVYGHPLPGDIVASASGTHAHVGIFVGLGKKRLVASANTAVSPEGKVTINDWAFRSGKDLGSNPDDRQYNLDVNTCKVFRRFVGYDPIRSVPGYTVDR